MALFKRKSKEEKQDVPKPAEVKAVKKAVVAKVQADNKKISHDVLLRPVISEKATHLAPMNKYTFEVAPKANKSEIKKAVKQNYGVMPIGVNIINQSGKWVRFGKNVGRTKQIKRAIVTLKKGDSIKLYEGI